MTSRMPGRMPWLRPGLAGLLLGVAAMQVSVAEPSGGIQSIVFQAGPAPRPADGLRTWLEYVDVVQGEMVAVGASAYEGTPPEVVFPSLRKGNIQGPRILMADSGWG